MKLSPSAGQAFSDAMAGGVGPWRPGPTGRPEPEISHVDLCRLSQLFCDATGPTTAQDMRINSWIVWHIATAAVRAALRSASTSPESEGGS